MSTIARSWLLLAVLAAASCTDDPAITEPVTSHAVTTASTPLAFYQMSGGDAHTCGITADNRLYCWGFNGWGNVGDGTDKVSQQGPLSGGPSLFSTGYFRHRTIRSPSPLVRSIA